MLRCMEEQPVRRRRRRRRSHKARNESIAWLTYFLSLGRRASHWVGLILIIGIILALGLGAPLAALESLFAFWSHW